MTKFGGGELNPNLKGWGNSPLGHPADLLCLSHDAFAVQTDSHWERFDASTCGAEESTLVAVHTTYNWERTGNYGGLFLCVCWLMFIIIIYSWESNTIRNMCLKCFGVSFASHCWLYWSALPNIPRLRSKASVSAMNGTTVSVCFLHQRLTQAWLLTLFLTTLCSTNPTQELS